jgi:hypothetical protein
MDSMSASPMVMEGTLSDDGKRLTQVGDGPAEDKLVRYKSVTDWKDDSAFEFTLFQMNNGQEIKIMSIVYARKK